MIGLLLPSFLAGLVALGLRRSSARFERIHVAWCWLAVTAFGVELVLYNPPINSLPIAVSFGPWIWVATRVALLLVVLRNGRPRSVWFIPCLVVALGLGLNTLVIVANGGYMPQSPEAAAQVWGSASNKLDSSRLENTRPVDESSRLAWLGDVLPEPRWLPRPNVLSIGDVLLSFGMASWILASLLRDTGAAGEGGNRSPALDIELDKDVLQMGFNRLHRNEEALSNPAI